RKLSSACTGIAVTALTKRQTINISSRIRVELSTYLLYIKIDCVGYSRNLSYLLSSASFRNCKTGLYSSNMATEPEHNATDNRDHIGNPSVPAIRKKIVTHAVASISPVRKK